MVSIARTNGRKAFTLIELLVVIAIISVLMAVAFPAIAVMSRLTRGGAGETTIGIAARTASAYAGKPKRTLSNPDPAGTPSEFSSNGAAVLFTPNGDIRILQTALLAFDNAGDPLQKTRYGYEDIPNRDYINLPDNTGVVGIIRVGSDIELITPPFAIHFDKFGQATTGYSTYNAIDPGDDVHMVFYDSNYDGKFDITDNRDTSYNPNEWNNKSDEWNGGMDDANLRPQLPFERIETVVGVLMYQIPDFNSGDGPPRTLTATGRYLNSNTRNWLLETADGKLVNAKAIFFSRNSGSILKEYR